MWRRRRTTNADGDTLASSSTDPDDSTDDGSGNAAECGRESRRPLREAQADGVEAPDDFVVRLITDIGKIDDRTFNQFAYEGMQAAADCFGFETSFIETASEADYAKNIATSLDGDPDLIVTVGFLLATDTLAAAEANPDVNFIGVDQFQPEYPDNYVGVQLPRGRGRLPRRRRRRSAHREQRHRRRRRP